MTGQLFFQKPDSQEIAFFKGQAETYGFDQSAYLNALSQVPIISEERVERTLDYLAQFASLLAELGLARLKQIEATGALETAHGELEREVLARTRQLSLANERLEGEISIRQETEKALQRTKTELETILDSVPALITYKDTKGRFIRVNKTYADLIGLTKEAVEGRTTTDIVPHPDLAERYLRDDQTVIASESPKRNIIEPLAFDPQRIVQVDKVPYRDHHGRVTGVIAIAMDISPRLAAETALRESEERLRIIFEFAPDAYYLSDLEGRLLDVNRAAERLSGYAKDELIGKNFLEIGLLSPGQVPTAMTHLKQNAQGTASGPDEYVVNRKDGTKLTAAITTYPVKIGNQTVILGIGRDITQQKQDEEQVAARMRRRRKQDGVVVQLATRRAIVKGELEVAAEIITESSADAMDVERVGVWLLNDDRTELQCLDLFEKTSRRHTKGQILRAADYPRYFEAFVSSRTIDAHDARSDSRTEEFRDVYLVPNGITSMLDAAIRVSGALVGVVCYEHVGVARTWHDDEITFAGEVADQTAQAIQNHRRVQADEALRESERRYRSLVENIPVAVYRTTAGSRGRFLMANPTFLKMFGLGSETELADFSVADVYDDPSQRKAFSERLIAEGIVEDAEFHLKKKDGTLFWGSVIARVQRGDNGEDVYFDCTIVDITARKRAEEEKQKLEAQLQHAQKMEAIGTLAGGIAHNFNNLLMAIQGNASLMMLETDREHPYFGMLKGIEKSVQSGSRLTNQLLGYAMEGRYEVRSLSLNQLVKETVDTFSRTRKDIRVHLDLAQDLGGVEADYVQIEQVLLNLLVNAADAMPTGGDLFFKTENVTERDMRNKPYKPKQGAYVLLTVRDTGFGMDQNTMERIFDPFFTTKGLSKGTGLGLASVYGIVKAHGGYIDVDSVKGQGSTFSIYLPVSVRAVSSTQRSDEGAINGSEMILLVDDEEVVLDVGIKVLEALGYRVLGAKGGCEALEIYQSNRDRIDLVILDMVMPDMAGGETYDRMKMIDRNIKVLLSSGYSIDGQASEILERGCDGFIQKPFSMEVLSKRIREVLD
jgi:PAS domain S-box-containing protein